MVMDRPVLEETKMRSMITTTAIALCLAAPAAAQTADEVVEKHLAAMGGRAAMAKLTTQVAKGTVSVSTPAGNIGGTIESSRKAPNKSRTFMVLDLSQFGQSDAVIDQRCDGTSGWVGNSLQGDQDLSGSPLQSMLNNTFPTPLLDYKAAGGKVELAGKDSVGGRPAVIVVHTPKAGTPTKYFVDAETYVLVRAVTTIEAPGAGAIEQTSEPGDYRDVDGIKVAFSVAITNPAQSLTITMSSVAFNAPVDDAIFAKPAK